MIQKWIFINLIFWITIFLLSRFLPRFFIISFLINIIWCSCFLCTWHRRLSLLCWLSLSSWWWLISPIWLTFSIYFGKLRWIPVIRVFRFKIISLSLAILAKVSSLYIIYILRIINIITKIIICICTVMSKWLISSKSFKGRLSFLIWEW